MRFLVGFLILCSIFFSPLAQAFESIYDYKIWFENHEIRLRQIKQYNTQVEQYKNMLQNTGKLDKPTWIEAKETMDKLVHSTDTLSYYKQQAGSMDAYLSKYKQQSNYRNAPCFNGGECTQAEKEALQQQEAEASEAQKRANDAMLRGIEQQQMAMQSDARQLNHLEGQAKDATGQMQALQAANQLASAETNQLLQIRGLMVAQQTAEATRAAAIADKEAMQAAGDERFLSGRFKKSSGKTW